MGLKVSKEIEAFTGILKDKIASKNGELILSLRGIILKEADGRGCIPQPPEMCYHSEIGVVSGEIEQRENEDNKIIDMSDVIHLWTPHTITNYSYSPNFTIPVKNKAIVQSSFSPCLNISKDKLMNIRDGEISFGSLEIVSLSNGHAITPPPYLSRLDVIVGDGKVIDFIKKEAPLTKTNRLLEILKDNEGLRRHREDYENEKRENIQESLTTSFSEVVFLNKKLDLIESYVLAARIEQSISQDGSKEDYWTNVKSVNRYFELEKKIREKQYSIKKILEDKDNLELISRGLVNGANIGFPAEISAQQYITHLKTEIKRIDERLKKVDAHLQEARRR